MALTRSFKETVKARAECDPAFRQALLSEAADPCASGRSTASSLLSVLKTVQKAAGAHPAVSAGVRP